MLTNMLVAANHSKYDITDQVLTKVTKMDISEIVNQIHNGSKPSLSANTN